MLKTRCIFAVLFFCLYLFPLAARSAPFCVESEGAPPECWYYDTQSCREEAGKRNGRCSANAEEVSMTDKSAPFCIVNSDKVTVCAYQSSDDCDREAAKQKSVCFENIEGDDWDPYRLQRMKIQ